MLRRAAVGILVVVGLIVGAIVVAAATGILRPYRVPSSAMEPTLHCARPAPGCEASTQDRVIALEYVFGADPAHGDLIVFHTPEAAAARCGVGGTFIKRIVAVSGERWEERRGYVYVDGRRLDEQYVRPDRRDDRTISPRRVPERSYIGLGDNRSQSCDSREWGPIPRKNVVGKIVVTYWPPNRISFR